MLALPCTLPGALNPPVACSTGPSSPTGGLLAAPACACICPHWAGRRPRPCTAPTDSAWQGGEGVVVTHLGPKPTPAWVTCLWQAEIVVFPEGGFVPP